MFNIPGPVLGLIAACALIQALTQWMGSVWNVWLIDIFAFVPGRITNWFDPEGVRAAIAQLAAQGRYGLQEAEVARFFLGEGAVRPWTVLTYAFLHGGWAHLLLNSLWLLAFGSAVARRFGPWRFHLLMALAALAGAGAHFAVYPYAFMPVVGASASVSGAMGAAIRFAFQPGAPLGGFGISDNPHAYRMPALPLSRVFTNARTLGFLVMWFAVNLLFGIGAPFFGFSESPIAWEAHIGGFLAGMLLFGPLDPVASGKRRETV